MSANSAHFYLDLETVRTDNRLSIELNAVAYGTSSGPLSTNAL